MKRPALGPIRILAVALIAVAAVFPVSTDTVVAAETLDQSQEVAGGNTAFYQPQGCPSAGVKGAAQTFTAGLSGMLTRVELYLAKTSWTTSAEGVAIEIRAADPAGSLLASSNTVLAADVPFEPDFAWVSFTFAAATGVTAGQVYAIVLPPDLVTNDDVDPTYRWPGPFADLYAGGVTWDLYCGFPTWQPYSGMAAGWDRTFRTYVDAATPADADLDGVLDADDVCPGTVTDAFPRLMDNRYSYDGTGLVSGLLSNPPHTIQETGGCSAVQIITAMGLGRGHERFGLSRSALEAWIAALL